MIKKIIACIFVIMMVQTSSYATNWEKIKVSDGNKDVYLDTDSIKINSAYAYYTIKYNKNNNYYIFDIVSKWDKSENSIMRVKKYTLDDKFIADYSPPGRDSFDYNIKKIEPNSINETVYNKVNLMARNNAFNTCSSFTWDNYSNGFEKSILKNSKIKKVKTKDNLCTSFKIIVNRNGEIISEKMTKPSGLDIFDNQIKEIVYGVKNIPLPKEYNGENLAININFTYNVKGENTSKDYRINQDGTLQFNITKEHITVVQVFSELLQALSEELYIIQ